MVKIAVAPLTGAWIEITDTMTINPDSWTSLPSRERGLKSRRYQTMKDLHNVAPLTGAWIEIVYPINLYADAASLPSRERGLKLLIL